LRAEALIGLSGKRGRLLYGDSSIDAWKRALKQILNYRASLLTVQGNEKPLASATIWKKVLWGNEPRLQRGIPAGASER
jgi:hypothetical protein